MCKHTSDIQDLRALVEELVDENAQLWDDNAKLSADHAKLCRDNADLREKLGKAQKRCAELVAANDDLEYKLEERIQGQPADFISKN